MKSIVYVSNTGYTAQYAEMLSKTSGLIALTLDEAVKVLPQNSEIIFMSWLMAGKVTEYKKAEKLFDIKAVCAVGLCESGTLIEETRKNNAIPERTAVFTLQGGYAPSRLKGIYRLIMKIVTKILIKKINGMENPAESDKNMRSTLQNGGTHVNAENLKSVIEFINK